MKNLTYFASGLLIFGLAAHAAAAPTLTVGAVTASAGTNVDLPINYTPGTTGISAIQFDLQLPAGVSYNTVITGPAASAAGKIASATAITGGVRVVVFEINQNIIGAGSLASVRVSIASGRAPGSFPISISGIFASDMNGFSVATSGVNGSLTVSAPAPVPSLSAKMALSAPVLDGSLSEGVWSQAWLTTFSAPTRSDNQVTVYSLWDATNLYIAYRVTDAQIQAVNTNGNLFQDDGVELLLDVARNGGATMDADDFHLMTNTNDLSDLYQADTTLVTGAVVKTAMVSGGYTQEIALPWSMLGSASSAGKIMGLLLGNNDRDTTAAATQLDWQNLAVTANYSQPGLWGQLILSSATAQNTVVPPPAPVINSMASATGQVGMAFSFQIMASNSPTGFGATGLPGGLSLNTASGLISGTPTTAGTSNVTLSATNAGGTGTKTLSLTINTAPVMPPPPPPPAPTLPSLSAKKALSAPVLDGNLAEDVWAQSFSTTFSSYTRCDNKVTVYSLWDATNLYIAYHVTDAQLQAVNTNMHEDDGAELLLDVTHDGGLTMGTDDFHLMTNINSLSALYQADTTLVSGTVIKTAVVSGGYSQEIAIPWSTLGSAATSGKILGLLLGNNDRDNNVAAMQLDWQNLAVTANYSQPSLWGQLILSSATVQSSTPVVPPPPPPPPTVTMPVITSPSTAVGQLGRSFSYQITATGNPTTFGASGLPSGLSLNTVSGLISGTPSQKGTRSVTITATNSGGTGTMILSLNVKTSKGRAADMTVVSLDGFALYPNPWRADRHNGSDITFDNLPAGAKIKIFNIAGQFVKELMESGEIAAWDRTNASGEQVASGIYIYLLNSPDGQTARGKIVVIR